MTDIYEKVSDYFLELASLQRLNILFKLLERNRKRIEPLAKELGATKQEVHRNLVRLEASGLITKEKDGSIALQHLVKPCVLKYHRYCFCLNITNISRIMILVVFR